MEDLVEVKKRGLKFVVKWEVVWLVMLGIIIEDVFLDIKINNYLVCLYINFYRNEMVLVWVDMLMGEFFV